MNLKNKKLIAVFVVPVVIIAVVAGYYLYPVEEPIHVEEGYDEITVTVPPYPEFETFDKEVTAISYINDHNNSMELTVRAFNWKSTSGKIFISVESELERSFEPRDLIVKVRAVNSPDINNTYRNFLISYLYEYDNNTINLETWDNHRNLYGARGERECFVGFDLTDRNFYMENLVLQIDYPLLDYTKEDLESPITIEITAVLRGLSEDVKATVRVTYVPTGGEVL